MTLLLPHLTHNNRIAAAIAQIGHGALSHYEIAEFFSSTHDAPIQIAVRDLRTGRIHLLDLSSEGSLHGQEHLPN